MSDLQTIEDWPEQETRGHSIPGSRYTSREFFDKEWEGMWTRVWLLLGRESELLNPGDWQMEAVGREEILMVRQKDQSIRAFYNVCQHRGNPLVEDDKGSVLSRFVCKYHSWAYTPDGELNFAPDKEDFPEGNPCGKIRLEQLACETFAGFIWVNMDPNCVSLKDFLGPIWDDWNQSPMRNELRQPGRPVAEGAVLDWALRIRVVRCPRHAERAEELLLEEVAVGVSGELLDQEGEDAVVRVRMHGA